MICESCKKNNASVHMIDVVNNSKQELHLCEDCAQSKGVTIKSHMQKGSSDKGIAEGLPEIFQSLSGSQGAAGVETCSQCDTTYRQFRSSGKFGCPHCYTAFRVKLSDLLEKIHGRAEHKGKVPNSAGGEVALQKELQDLMSDLDHAVSDEAYERAAELRDRIQRLQEGPSEI
ncbi:MAG: UvrB/UvrC motif-containing protein [Planctomycetota bacterium]|nr:UvrB/UvrC motif-containing protein [Planctomycetota bacterium]